MIRPTYLANLDERGISPAQLAELVDVRDGGFVLLCGSMVDGWPNPDSDIDLLAVDAAPLAEDALTYSDGKCDIYTLRPWSPSGGARPGR